MKISLTVFKLYGEHDFQCKGAYFLKNVDGVAIHFLCTSPDGGLQLYKVS